MARRRAMDIDFLYEPDPMDISPFEEMMDPFEQWKLNLIKFGERKKNTETGSGPYEGRTVQQLRATCAKKGLTITGTKAQLIRRLRK